MTEPTLTGGCHCGAIRYEAVTGQREGYYCHCRMCQLSFGNLFAAFVHVKKADVRWAAGEPAYFRSSKFAQRGFCRSCGTPLSFEFHDSENMDLSVGSLDDPGSITPAMHFAVESRVPSWHREDGLPEKRLDEHKELMRRWRENYGEGVTPSVEAARARR